MAATPALGQTPAASGQTPAPSKPGADSVRVAPLRVQVVIARYQGDKRVSSMPHTMSMNAGGVGGGTAQIRMGADVPISTKLATSEDRTGGTIPTDVKYDQIGTQIDCRVRLTDDGRYLLDLTISERSVYGENEGPQVAKPGRNPIIRSFRSSNSVVLRDGQSTEFAAATDRLSGEIVRVEVSLQVVK